MSTPPVTATTENYLTLIWKAFEWPGSPPSTTDLAAQLGVTPSTVSANLKRLARDGFITYTAYGPIELTDAGRAVAVPVVRRHRIIETYLVQRLQLSWDEVHDEADSLEHAVSELLLTRMDEALGHPEVDPHGDVIPRADGSVPDRPASTELVDVEPGCTVRVVRVSDRHPEILRYLQDKGVAIGSVLVTVERSRAAGVVQVRDGDVVVELSEAAARAIRTVPASGAGAARLP